MEQPITALQTPDCDWLLHRFIEVNFSKLTDSNKNFRNSFVCLHYHLYKISSKTIECIMFAPYELYNNCLLYECTEHIKELTLAFRPMLSTFMLYSNQLLVYQFNTLWDGHILMSSEKHPSNYFRYKFRIDLFLCVKTAKTLNIWIIFLIA